MEWSYPTHGEIRDAFVDLLLRQGPPYEMYLTDVYEQLADYFGLSEDERTASYLEVVGRGDNASYWENKVRTAKARLIDRGVLHPSAGRGICKLLR